MRLSMRESIRLAIREEMMRDSSVIVFGEDVAREGGVFKVTAGLLEQFGQLRVRDTPISETAIVGAAVGAAAAGLRPVIEIMFAEFFGVAMDQVITELAKMRYLSGGRLRMPVVIRASAGGGLGFGAQHSQTTEAWFMSTPGIIVASPSGPREAYGLTRAAIQSDDPVILIEPRSLYGLKEEFDPAVEPSLQLGTAAVVRRGRDATLVALGQMVRVAIDAAERLAPAIECEVIDLRTILPWDRELVIGSVERTHRLITIEESPFTGGWGNDIASFVGAALHGSLRGPIVRVTCPDAPVPSGPLEKSFLPSAEDVVHAVQVLVERNEAPPPRWDSWGISPPLARTVNDTGERRRTQLVDPVARFERMHEIRAFEDAVADLFAKGLIAGASHTSQGQEAVAVGIGAATRSTDFVTCTYRGHGVALALGADPTTLMAEILGRRTGCVRGRGGSMHLTALEVGLLPSFAIVGAGIPVAAGAALAAQVRENDGVAIAVFGDGASNIGAFHEALNLATVWRLPAVFVCENNLYGEYSPISLTTSVTDIAQRASGYGMPGHTVDGMDVEAVLTAMKQAVARARSGAGPSLLEMKTYRFSGHSRGDPAQYRSADEVAAWQARDPLLLEARRLQQQGIAGKQLQEARIRAADTIAASVAAALASEPAELGDIMADVWSDPVRAGVRSAAPPDRIETA